MNTVSYFLCPYTNFITIIVVSRRSHHPYVININGLMWDCYINTALVMALDELLSICGHAYSLDLGRIACTQAHSRITDIAIAGLRLWQDPVTNGWSRNVCECVALPIWICIIFNGIIIVTICIIIIIIMWQFYVRSLTCLLKLIPTLSTLWVHLLFCSGGRNNNDNILYAIPKVISYAHIP